jgi:uncharacterized membrane protein YtjA (UPF0391 family)
MLLFGARMPQKTLHTVPVLEPKRYLRTGTDAATADTIHASNTEDCVMLYWAAVFFVIALLAAIFGFGGLAASAAGVAKILFFVFLVFALVSFLFGRRSAA